MYIVFIIPAIAILLWMFLTAIKLSKGNYRHFHTTQYWINDCVEEAGKTTLNIVGWGLMGVLLIVVFLACVYTIYKFIAEDALQLLSILL